MLIPWFLPRWITTLNYARYNPKENYISLSSSASRVNPGWNCNLLPPPTPTTRGMCRKPREYNLSLLEDPRVYYFWTMFPITSSPPLVPPRFTLT